MSKQAFSWLWAACGPVLMVGAGSAGATPTVTVTVAGGVMTVYPLSVDLSATDDSIVWTLNAPGFIFSAGDGIVIGGDGPKFACTTSRDGLSATCRRGGAGLNVNRPYTINLLPVGSGPNPPPQPNAFIVDF